MLASVQPAKFASGEVHQGCWKNIEERLFIDQVKLIFRLSKNQLI